jgi:hypothetical protein
MGWAGLPAEPSASSSGRAGCVSAAALRSALLAELASRANVRVVRAAAGAVVVHADGTVSASTSGRRRTPDVASSLPARGRPACCLPAACRRRACARRQFSARPTRCAAAGRRCSTTRHPACTAGRPPMGGSCSASRPRSGMSHPAVAPRPPRCTRRRHGSPGFAGRSHGSLQFGHVMADPVAAARPHAHDGQRDRLLLRPARPRAATGHRRAQRHLDVHRRLGRIGQRPRLPPAARTPSSCYARQLQHSTRGE